MATFSMVGTGGGQLDISVALSYIGLKSEAT